MQINAGKSKANTTWAYGLSDHKLEPDQWMESAMEALLKEEIW